MIDAQILRLYLCTDRVLALGRPLDEAVDAAIAGGVTVVQFREKNRETKDLYESALALRRITKARGIPLVINDRLDIALAVDADGVHLGPEDLPVREARRITAGKPFWIGFSAGTPAEARAAEADGADYLGAGAVFQTNSKADAGTPIGTAGLERICSAVRIPVIGIGGVGPHNAPAVLNAGAVGVAVISAILSQPDVKAAAERLRRIIEAV